MSQKKYTWDPNTSIPFTGRQFEILNTFVQAQLAADDGQPVPPLQRIQFLLAAGDVVKTIFETAKKEGIIKEEEDVEPLLQNIKTIKD
jgi:hypothetical protein